MAFSNLIALAIMLATAATLHAQGVTHIGSAADAAQALRADRRPASPSLLFAVGIIGTGLLAVPVLAGSAAFAVSEIARLEGRPRIQAAARRRASIRIIVAATFIGVAIDWSQLDPIQALFWSAVLNGVAAVPHHGRDDARRLEPQHHGPSSLSGAVLLTFGWARYGVMALASAAMLVSSFSS